MSDNKDGDTTKSPVEFDSESTIELDISKLGIVTSPSANEDPPDDDLDDVDIDDLMEIYDNLKKEVPPATGPDSHEQDSSHADVDFGKLNAEDIPEPAGEADENLAGGEYLPETAEKPVDSDHMFDLSISDLPDEDAEEESEFLTGNSAAASDEPPLMGSTDDEALQPVVELTEEMLADSGDSDPDSPELSTGENDLLSEAVHKFSDGSSASAATDNHDADDLDLTTREISVTAAAEATAKDVYDDEEEEEIPEIDVELVAPPEPETTADNPTEEPVADVARKPGSGGSNAIPVLFGILGLAAGGFGGWMAFDATEKVADLERRVQTLSVADSDSKSRDMADIQQRLGKIERRLMGAPTLEAAAPLGTTQHVEGRPPEPAEMVASQPEPAEEIVLQSEPVTPQTPISPTPSNGDWVVNISSHANEEMATRENARLQGLGLNSEIHAAQIRERTWYRIQITGFASKDEAKAKLRELRQYSGIEDPWIGKQ
ncbi:MAG: SPOR domain-containing protein [Mariprofundaceae bacterium]|nr:SPOR domain-containing protein [Mariprofundaceae bacterium]